MINDVPWSFTFFCQDRLKMIPARARARAPASLFSRTFHDRSLRSIDEHLCVHFMSTAGETMTLVTVASNVMHATHASPYPSHVYRPYVNLPRQIGRYMEAAWYEAKNRGKNVNCERACTRENTHNHDQRDDTDDRRKSHNFFHRFCTSVQNVCVCEFSFFNTFDITLHCVVIQKLAQYVPESIFQFEACDCN